MRPGGRSISSDRRSSAPGFIGTLQYAGALALRQYGVDPSLALSFTLIYHASQWFPVTALGYRFDIVLRGRDETPMENDLPAR